MLYTETNALTLIGRFIYFGCILYQITDGNIGNNTISLRNIMTGNYARHRYGRIENYELVCDEVFLYDSSFYVEVDESRIRLYCSNEGLETCCVTDINNCLRIIEKHICDEHNLLNTFELIDSHQIPIKDHILPTDLVGIKVVAFGSSSTEIFDYIFGDNPDYIPFWASGWSARGLRNAEKHVKPYRKYLENIYKDSIILLHFGSVDIDFNLRFKLEKTGLYRTDIFLKEMVDGILNFKKYLYDEFGFNNVYAVFTAPSVHLEPEYWKEHFGFYPLPSKMKAKMLWDFAIILSSQMAVINCLPDLVESIENPICDNKYTRDIFDHHIDFVAAQDIIYNKLKNIPNMLPKIKNKHTQLYEHLIYDVYDVVNLNKPRPRTCR